MKYLFLLAFSFLIVINQTVFSSTSDCITSEGTKSFVYLPLKNIQMMSSEPKIRKEFSDSFFCHAANQLILNYLSEHPNLTRLNTNTDSMNIDSSLFFINQDSGDTVKNLFGDISSKFKADYIIIFTACSLKNKIITQNSWRDGKGGPSYARPVKSTFKAQIHLKVLNTQNLTVCDLVETSTTNRPMFYSYFGKKVKLNDIEQYARKHYAHPFIRAINKAGRNLLK